MEHKDRIIWTIADKACEDICSKVIGALQKMDYCTLSGEESGLQNIWEEVCVQVQFEQSFYWKIYLDEIKNLISSEIDKLEEYVRKSIWFTTDKGEYWENYFADEDAIDFNNEDIVDYILNIYLWDDAFQWSNENTERYMSRYDRY